MEVDYNGASGTAGIEILNEWKILVDCQWYL